MAQYEALQLNEDWIWTTLRALAQTSIIPTWATYLWLLLFFCWFFKAPSCPALLYRMRFLSGLNCYSEKRHALLRSEWLEKNPFTHGPLPTGHSNSFLADLPRFHLGKETPRRKDHMNDHATTYFASSDASHQYEPRSWRCTGARKCKNAPLDIHRLP